MGRKNKNYSKTLHQQTYEKLVGLQAFGESKAAAKKDGTYKEKIFSFTTYQTYWKHIKYFIKWMQKEHPECTTLKAAKKYVNTFLETRTALGLSAWTVSLECAALCKLYGIAPDDPKRFQPPQRRRQDIRRSRVETVRDRHFSVTNNAELIEFVKGTGTRRNVLERLEGRDLWSREQMLLEVSSLEGKQNLSAKEKNHLATLKDALETFPDEDWFIHHRRDKGGRYRFAIICSKRKDKIIERFQNTPPNDMVWYHVPGAMDVHNLRAQYAAAVYKKYARKISDIPYDRVNRGSGRRFQSEVYYCRRDESGKRLDKKAMMKTSKALGHARLDVIAYSYLYNI